MVKAKEKNTSFSTYDYTTMFYTVYFDLVHRPLNMWKCCGTLLASRFIFALPLRVRAVFNGFGKTVQTPNYVNRQT